MSKFCFILGLVVVVLVAESKCQRYIFPTYRPPPQPRQPIIRTARDTRNDEPLWLYQGDDVIKAPSTAEHPVLPSVIDDVNFGPTRHARSLSTPGGGYRGGSGSSSGGSRGHGTDASNSCHGCRVARSVHDTDDQPLWLYQGDDVIKAPSTAEHPVLPSVIDDVNFGPTRHARSLSTPGGGYRGGSSSSGGSRGQGTDASNSCHGCRVARSVHLPDFVTMPPFNPKPWTVQPQRPRFPIDA